MFPRPLTSLLPDNMLGLFFSPDFFEISRICYLELHIEKVHFSVSGLVAQLGYYCTITNIFASNLLFSPQDRLSSRVDAAILEKAAFDAPYLLPTRAVLKLSAPGSRAKRSTTLTSMRDSPAPCLWWRGSVRSSRKHFEALLCIRKHRMLLSTK
jgi:hypothetical protein